VAIADVTGDERPDLVVSGAGNVGLAVLAGTVGGTLAPPMTYAYGSGQLAVAVAVADVTGDGHPDVITAGATANQVWVLSGGAGGSLAVLGAPLAMTYPYALATGDLNADGTPDAVVANSTGGGSASVLTALDGQFGVVDEPIGSSPSGVAVADVTGDGRPDIVTSNAGPSTVSVLSPVSFDADLSSLTLATATLSPAFGADTTAYEAAVPYSTSAIDLTATTADAGATLAVGAQGATSGSAVHTPLSVGPNPVTVAVTAPDGTTVKTTTVTITRDAGERLTVVPAGSGTGAIAGDGGIDCHAAAGAGCAATYDGGATVTLTATPDAGSRFAGFSGDGTADCGGTTCTVTMDQARSVTATFVETVAPTVAIVTPADGARYGQDDAVVAAYSCADEPGGSGIASCVGPVADGAPLDTATLGEHEFSVTATDAAGNTSTTIAHYSVVADVDGPVLADLTIPSFGAPGQQLAFSVAPRDERSGVGETTWDFGDGTHATGTSVTHAYAAPGDYTVTVTARDGEGNATTQTWQVLISAAAVTPPPGGGTGGAAGAPVTPVACGSDYVELIGIEPSGTARHPRVRLTGVAGRPLAGAHVTILRNGHHVAGTTVRADGTIAATLAAPTRAKARNGAHYALAIGTHSSRSLKATRRVAITSRSALGGGRLRIRGRLAGVARATTLTVVGTPVCGGAKGPRATLRTDRRGAFSLVLAPPTGAGAAALVYRVHYARKSVTLPIVLTAAT